MSLLQKLQQRSRWARMRSAFALGTGAKWLRDRPGLRILLYHGIVPAPVKRINARFVSTDQFEAQMRYVRKHFQVISLDQVYTADYDPNRLAVAVTFDDGYRNNLTHGLPTLLRHQVPASVFVTAPRAVGQDILWADLLDIASAVSKSPISIAGETYHKDRKGEYVSPNGERLKAHCKLRGPSFIAQMQKAMVGAAFKNDPQWAEYWQLLNEQELHQLAAASGITIGGHGTLHHNLDLLSADAAISEVELGRNWIESAINKPIRAFAFPDGAYSPTLVDTLTNLGFSQLLLTDRHAQDLNDPRLRERFTIHPFLSTKVLIAEMLKGHYF